jgi:hypothetical protein
VTVEALSAELQEPAVDVLVMPAVVCLTQPARGVEVNLRRLRRHSRYMTPAPHRSESCRELPSESLFLRDRDINSRRYHTRTRMSAASPNRGCVRTKPTSNLQSEDAPDNVNIEYMWFEDRGGGLTQLPDRFADHAVRRLLAVAS